MAEVKTKGKPGPVPGPEKRQFTILIEPDLGEWGKHQPGGLSELVRRLLREERAKYGYPNNEDNGGEDEGDPDDPFRA